MRKLNPNIKLKQDAKRKERRAWLDALKTATPCTDCGLNFPPCVMHYDHTDPATKEFHISKMVGGNTKKLLAEIAKCELVCANCHAIRTFITRPQGRSGQAQKLINTYPKVDMTFHFTTKDFLNNTSSASGS
jgi:hypothetical protein